MPSIYLAAQNELHLEELREAALELGGPFRLCGQALDSESALAGLLGSSADILLTETAMPSVDGAGLPAAAAAARKNTLVIQCDLRAETRRFDLLVGSTLLASGTLAEVASSAAAELRGRPVLSGPAPELADSLRAHLLRRLLHGEGSTVQILEEASLIGLPLAGRCYALLALHLQAGDGPVQIEDLWSALAQWPDVLPYFDGQELLTVLVMSGDAAAAVPRAKEVMQACTTALRGCGLTVTAVFGGSIDRLQAVPDAYQAAAAMLEQARTALPGEIVDTSGMPHSGLQSPWSVSFSGAHERDLRAISARDVPLLLRSFLQQADSAKLDGVLYRFHLLADILAAALRVVASRNPDADPSDLTAGYATASDVFSAAATRASFEANALQILERAVRMREAGPLRAAAPDAIERAVQFVQENYAQSDLSLQQAASCAGFSAAHFSTVFSRKMGRTFIDYLTSVRISKAKELLAGTDRKLSSIAMEVGYNDPNYFSHVFKKREGISPKEYRRRIGSGA